MPALNNLPTIHPRGIASWRAYSILSSKRHYGEHGPQAIPMSEIAAYAEFRGMGVGERDELLIVVSALDDVFLEHHRKAKPASQAAGTGTGAGRRPGPPRPVQRR